MTTHALDTAANDGWTLEPLRLFTKTLPDGTKVGPSALLMVRRNEKGEKEYRRPTREEEADYVSRDAW